jgi:hypothetical protein
VAIKTNIIMAKQMGYVKAVGTVDGDINFYKDVEWGYLSAPPGQHVNLSTLNQPSFTFSF